MDKNIAIIFHRIGPYHFSRIRAAGDLMPMLAVEMSGQDGVYKWDKVIGTEKFKRVTVFAEDSRSLPSSTVICNLHRVLDEHKPAVVVINGWSEVEALGAISWCLDRGVRAVVMSESTEWDERRVAWKEWIKSRVVRMCSAGLVGATPHLDYLVKLGMPHGQISLGYDAVDNDYFSTKAGEARKLQSALRKQFKLPQRYFLASARFIEKKNLPRLIQAYARYRTFAGRPETGPLASDTWQLVLLGDGPLKSDLCHLISDLGLQDSVLLPGFVQYPDLPNYYGLAGAFVHASTTEQWGLVVNEAMASGLPVLVSNRCGCAQDLVQEGVNGFTFDPYNVEQLANLMLKVSVLPVLPGSNEGGPVRHSFSEGGSTSLASMGEASRRIIANWSPDRFAAGLKAAVETALSAPRPKPTLLDRVLLNLLLRRRPRTDA